MTVPLFHLILVLTITAYDNNKNKYGSSNVEGTDTICNCSSVSSSVCMTYQCSTTIRRASCFPGSSRLALQDGTFKDLFDINIGDRVLVNEHGRYEPVIAFIHGEHEGLYGFLAFDIQSPAANTSSTIFISSRHLMFDYDSGKERFANSFQIGQRVQFIENNKIVPGNITQIRATKMRGFYAPLTPSGTIVVNGVLCSNYAAVENHNLAHYVMGLYRWWIRFAGAPKFSNQPHWTLEFMYNLERITGLQLWETLLNTYL